MKQIFDWLREQVNKHSYAKYDDGNYFPCFIATKIATDLISAAEAKWEEDCCEWRISEFADEWMPVCRNGKCFRLRGVRKYKFCPYCGKPIKITEVE